MQISWSRGQSHLPCHLTIQHRPSYIDYRCLDKMIIKKKYPLPLIAYLFNQLGMTWYFTKLNLRLRYYQICIAKGQEAKTVCITRYGAFEYFAMTIGLTNGTKKKIYSQALGCIYEARVRQDGTGTWAKCTAIRLNKAWVRCSGTVWVWVRASQGCIMVRCVQCNARVQKSKNP